MMEGIFNSELFSRYSKVEVFNLFEPILGWNCGNVFFV